MLRLFTSTLNFIKHFCRSPAAGGGIKVHQQFQNAQPNDDHPSVYFHKITKLSQNTVLLFIT